jgi:cysteine synthase
MKAMDLAKLEYVNPVGSIKDRPAYWILQRSPSRTNDVGVKLQ